MAVDFMQNIRTFGQKFLYLTFFESSYATSWPLRGFIFSTGGIFSLSLHGGVTLRKRGTYCQGYLGFAKMYLELLELLLELLLQLLLELLLLLLLS